MPRKMIAPRGSLKIPAKRKRNPPPPVGMAELIKANSHDISLLEWNTTVFHNGVLLRFNDEIQLVFMSAKGARDIAASLVARADELDAKQKKAHA